MNDFRFRDWQAELVLQDTCPIENVSRVDDGASRRLSIRSSGASADIGASVQGSGASVVAILGRSSAK